MQLRGSQSARADYRGSSGRPSLDLEKETPKQPCRLSTRSGTFRWGRLVCGDLAVGMLCAHGAAEQYGQGA